MSKTKAPPPTCESVRRDFKLRGVEVHSKKKSLKQVKASREDELTLPRDKFQAWAYPDMAFDPIKTPWKDSEEEALKSLVGILKRREKKRLTEEPDPRVKLFENVV